MHPTTTGRSLTGALVLRVGIPVATMLVIGVLAVLALMTPFYMHPALDAASSAAWLGTTPSQAHEYSDQTIGDLFAPSGEFAIFSADERAHMRDVRVVLWGFLGLAALGVAGLAVAYRRRADRTDVIRAIGRGGAVLAVGAVVVGAVAAVAFEAVFELFHRIFFPGGNWSFDPTTSRLVQLYPEAFWEITSAALGVLLVGGGLIVWLMARRSAAR
jgi:integral membrane protein (TIGR01906 family)